MICYKINIDGFAYDVYAKDLKSALYAIALTYGCSYTSLGTNYYENEQLLDYRYNDLIYYDRILSSLRS